MKISEKFGVLFVVTKFGMMHIFEISTGTCLQSSKISETPVFGGAKDS